MNRSRTLWKLAGLLGFSGLAILGAVSAPTASFEMTPTNPAAGSEVQFTDTSSGATSWQWTFGDGQNSAIQNPTHVFAAAGSYPVTLKVNGSGGQSQTTLEAEVSAEDTLRLLGGAGHAFEVTLQATDPRTGNAGVGKAIPQNDVFGYFTIPALVPTNPGAPLVPEVFVKMLDARAIGQDFWLFWGGLTDLQYTLTVRDTVTGVVKVKHNPVTDSLTCLGADTGGFASVPTPTPTPTGVAPSPTPTPTAPPAQTRDVDINDFFFRDRVSGNSTTTVDAGTKVEWHWVSGFHSTTSGPCPPCSGDGVWNSNSKSSGTFDHTFTDADRGKSFAYFCLVHGSVMTGKVNVNP
jgi:PKD repeat protein